jgi:glycosyltransferase involved in cell wall biosynthesis
VTGVSFVVPVRNGATLVRGVLESIAAEADGRPLELIVVDDGSTDGSWELLGELGRRLESTLPVRLIRRGGGGAAAAINAGVAAARYPIVCQVDQDLRLQPGWLNTLTSALEDPGVGAAQGCYTTDPASSCWSRVTGLDLDQRYAAIAGDTDHVCTGNAAYRTDALRRVGLFDEAMGYGYDNDMSYRLRAAGYRLVFCPSARAFHAWREGPLGYLIQQYGFGYGRLDVVAKHRRRFTGDKVSPPAMMLHPIVMLIAVAMLAASAGAAVAGRSAPALSALGVALVGVLAIERLSAGLRAARQFRDRTAWLFPLAHLLRDLAWVVAIVVWSLRRVSGRPGSPSHSMRPRSSGEPAWRRSTVGPARTIALVPAHNESANLPSVVADVTRHRPDLALLVIDDGSLDDTAAHLDRLGVPSIRLPERMGIGAAMRAGLRYAARLGFDAAVRLDGDGQHDAADIDALLEPIRAGRADVVLGTRYETSTATKNTTVSERGGSAIRVLRLSLATCLTALTGRRVTDPTSGFCAFNSVAVRLLAEHHPDGYAEPELRLFLSRNGLRVIEIPVRARARLSGRTSLTPRRLALAAARVTLAMLIVPLRAAVREPRV